MIMTKYLQEVWVHWGLYGLGRRDVSSVFIFLISLPRFLSSVTLSCGVDQSDNVVSHSMLMCESDRVWIPYIDV